MQRMGERLLQLAFYYVLGKMGEKKFCYALDESLAFLIIMLTAKYNFDFYKMFRLLEPSKEWIHIHGNQRTFPKQNYFLEIEIIFFLSSCK